ncbi:MAG: hypothetical protein SFU20_12825 [Chitinophagaceae bacterium]|nr:hypothetical protein [Chitinophagaceae bacterium]
MNAKNKSLLDNIHYPSLIKRMIPGAVIGLILIGLLLFTADDADPAWGKYWMLRPLIVVPIAAAFGSGFSYFLEPIRKKGGWYMVLAIVLSLIVFLIALWMGTVVGLDGTYWN